MFGTSLDTKEKIVSLTENMRQTMLESLANGRVPTFHHEIGSVPVKSVSGETLDVLCTGGDTMSVKFPPQIPGEEIVVSDAKDAEELRKVYLRGLMMSTVVNA